MASWKWVQLGLHDGLVNNLWPEVAVENSITITAANYCFLWPENGVGEKGDNQGCSATRVAGILFRVHQAIDFVVSYVLLHDIFCLANIVPRRYNS